MEISPTEEPVAPPTTAELIDRLHAQYQVEYDALFSRMLSRSEEPFESE